MSWGRIDDHLDDDLRLMGLDPQAGWLWTMCLPYCLRAESPKVSRALAIHWGGESACASAQILVDRGLWKPTDDGWEYATGGFAGWDAIVIPAEVREALEAKRSEAGKASVAVRRLKYGSAHPARWPSEQPSEHLSSESEQNRNASERIGTRNPLPDPDPDPVHVSTSTVSGAAPAPDRWRDPALLDTEPTSQPPGHDEAKPSASGADRSSPLGVQLTPTRPRGDGLTATDEVATVFRASAEATGRNGRTKLTTEKRRVIQARLRDYPLEDVVDAVVGIMCDPWHVEHGVTELKDALRDGTHLERFRDLKRGLIAPPREDMGPVERETRRLMAAGEVDEATLAQAFGDGR